MLSDDIYRDQYLVKSMGKVFINNLRSGQYTPVSLSGSQVGIEKTFLGETKRIEISEALKLIEAGYPVYEKFSNEFRIII